MNLDQLKQSLEAKRDDLEDRLARVAKHTGRRDDPLPPDSGEQAQELENEELMFALDEQLATELVSIKRALARIDSGEYEECASCGGEIGQSRLAALPYTTLCISCAERSEAG